MSEPTETDPVPTRIDPAATVSELAEVMLGVATDPAAASIHHERVGELLEALPPAVRDMLLSEHYRHGEAVLTYAGKRTRGEILGDPHKSPLQVVKTFGEPEGDWVNKLIFGDNIAVLRALREEKRQGRLKNSDGTDGFRVVYIDPPFATQREFSGTDGTTAYADKREGAEFIEFLRERLVLIHDLLADNGTLWLHLDTKKVHYIKVMLDELFGEGCFQSSVEWKSDTAKGHKSKKPLRQHDTLLMYTKSSTSWVWNVQYTPYSKEYVDDFYKYDDGDGRGPYTRSTLQAPAHNNYNYDYKGWKAPNKGWVCPLETMEKWDSEGRIWFPDSTEHQPRKKRFLREMPGVPLQDLWLDIAPVMRPRYPTEKPPALLERVLVASSNPGDLVLDCFSGSGSTLRAAEKLGRRWVGVDVGKLAVHTAARDLLKVKRDDGNPVSAFQVIHGGLYDHQQLTSRPFSDWKAFVLALYDCRPASFEVGGVEFDGLRGPRGAEKVLVYDWAENPDSVVTDAYVRSLHAALAPHIKRGLVSVIVPLHIAPTLVADTYTVGGLTVRILRVPPSASARAAEGGITGFAELSQPVSEKQVNLIIKTEGFDFVIQPIVARKLSTTKAGPRVTLTKFEADGRRHADAKLPDDGRDDLAMVLIDYDHIDFEASFDFETVVWAADMTKSIPAWSFTLDQRVLTKRVAITWVDKFGNEMREVIEPDEWKKGAK